MRRKRRKKRKKRNKRQKVLRIKGHKKQRAAHDISVSGYFSGGISKKMLGMAGKEFVRANQ